METGQVMRGSLVVVIVSLFCCAPEALGQVRIRENYRKLNAAQRQKFRDALVAMKNTPDVGQIKECSSPLGKLCNNAGDCNIGATCDVTCTWANKYDKYVCWHDRCGCQVIGGPTQHGRPQILPWHRELLVRFELDLRNLPPTSKWPSGFGDVTIPYWKWTEPFPSHLVDGNSDNDFLGSKNSGYIFTHWTTINGGNLQFRSNASAVAGFSQSDITAVLNHTSYDAPDAARLASDPLKWIHKIVANGFRPHWERLHDLMHGSVGGALNSFGAAADDPVFWLAHCYFDCMWAAWEQQHGTHVDGAGNPAFCFKDCYRPDKARFGGDAPTPAGEDAVDIMAPWNLKTIRDVLNVRDLGYDYDTTHDCKPPDPRCFLSVPDGPGCDPFKALGGEMDNFCPGTDPASPGPNIIFPDPLCTNVPAVGGGPSVDFDDPTINRVFCHSFTNVKDPVDAAILEIRLKALGELDFNDTISLGGGTGLKLPWTRNINGLLGVSWPSNSPHSFCLNLSALPNEDGTTMNILPSLTGILDIRVQDDTSVDYAVLFQSQCRKTVPTVSAWGLVVLTSLVVTGIVIKFGRRRRV